MGPVLLLYVVVGKVVEPSGKLNLTDPGMTSMSTGLAKAQAYIYHNFIRVSSLLSDHKWSTNREQKIYKI